MALLILDRRSRQVGKPFHLVIEVESTDNLPNNTNAIGTLQALKRADDVIAEYELFRAQEGPCARTGDDQGFDTLILTAADSDGGGLQVLSLNRTTDEDAAVGARSANRTELPGEILSNPLDGVGGREVFPPFRAEPDELARFRPLPDGDGNTDGIAVKRLRFAVSWPSSADVAGGILSRAAGPNAPLLQSEFSERFDNTDAYRLQYATLFGVLLEDSVGELAPTRSR